MRTQTRWVLCIGLITMALLLSGCLYNIFQTAAMIRGGDVGLAVGSGLVNMGFDDDPLWMVTPQARVAFGLSDTVNLGVQSGVGIPLTTGSPGWMGAVGDIKVSILEDPGPLAVAVGAGGGFSVEWVGWGVFGQILLDSNLRAFPVFAAYQLAAPLSGGGRRLWHHLAVGWRWRLSEQAQMLLQVDLAVPLISFGVAVDIGHWAPIGKPAD